MQKYLELYFFLFVKAKRLEGGNIRHNFLQFMEIKKEVCATDHKPIVTGSSVLAQKGGYFPSSLSCLKILERVQMNECK